jgi:uncharacterized protein (DUF433 family)
MIPMDRIELNPRVCNGRPVIKGTRIPVSVILDQIAEGESWSNILAGYPELKKEDIQAALIYARASLDHTEDGAEKMNIEHPTSNVQYRMGRERGEETESIKTMLG